MRDKWEMIEIKRNVRNVRNDRSERNDGNDRNLRNYRNEKTGRNEGAKGWKILCFVFLRNIH